MKKVERQITKSPAALLLESRMHEQFDAIVTGETGNRGDPVYVSGVSGSLEWTAVVRRPAHVQSYFKHPKVAYAV